MWEVGEYPENLLVSGRESAALLLCAAPGAPVGQAWCNTALECVTQAPCVTGIDNQSVSSGLKPVLHNRTRQPLRDTSWSWHPWLQLRRRHPQYRTDTGGCPTSTQFPTCWDVLSQAGCNPPHCSTCKMV